LNISAAEEAIGFLLALAEPLTERASKRTAEKTT
jgi:hypothetical protein